jgi:hypothetical protein
MFLKIAGVTYRLFATWMNKTIEPPDRHMSDLAQALSELHPCDVVLVEGRSRAAGLIKAITQTNWTHVALYVGRICDQNHPHIKLLLHQHYTGSETDHLLVEAELGSGAILTSIEKYFDYHVRICRPKTLTRKDKTSVLIHALKRLGIEYDIRQLLDLARWLYPYSLLPRRWRSSLFEQNIDRRRTHTICSTLIVEAFYSVDYPIRPHLVADELGELRLSQANARTCIPRDFDASPYFDILKYPLIQLKSIGMYRHLPWIHHAHTTALTFTIPLSKDLWLKDIDNNLDWIQKITKNVYTGYGRRIEIYSKAESLFWKSTQWLKHFVRIPANR